MKVILASKSLRRRQLIGRIFEDVVCTNPEVDETCPPGMEPEEYCVYLAEKKADSVVAEDDNTLVIGCDTAVVMGKEIFGKPKDRQDAQRMLKLFSGNTHQVMTGVCIKTRNKKISFCQVTEVHFYPITDKDIERYLDMEEYTDKAGGYAIQGGASLFIEGIEGDYYNVVGLPIGKIYQEYGKMIADT